MTISIGYSKIFLVSKMYYNNIKELRKFYKMSTASFAKLLNISAYKYHAYESHRFDFPINYIFLISKIFNIPINNIIFFSTPLFIETNLNENKKIDINKILNNNNLLFEMIEFQKNISNIIKQLRINNKVSYLDVSKHLNIDELKYINKENCIEVFTITEITLLSELFNIEVKEVIQ